MVSTLLYSFFADLTPILLTLALLIPYFGMYRARRAKNVFVFLGAHIGLVIWPLFLPVIWTPRMEITDHLAGAPLSYLLIGFQQQQIAPLRICWFVILLISAIRSIRSRLTGKQGFETGYLCFGIALLTVLSLITGYYGMRAVTAINALWAFVWITGYLVYSQTVRIDESLEVYQFSGKKPVAAILRFNNAILAVFLIPVVMFAALSPWLPLDRAASLLGQALLAGLRGLFWFIGWIMSFFNSEPETPMDETPPPAQEMAPMMEEASETPAWIAFIEMLVNILMQIALVGLIAAAIAYGAYRFYKRFIATRGSGAGGEDGGDISEYIGPKLALKPIAEALGGLLRRLSPKTEEEKIRRMYFKKVRWHIKRGAEVKPADTAQEIAVKLRPAEDIGELTSLYERARYGSE